MQRTPLVILMLSFLSSSAIAQDVNEQWRVVASATLTKINEAARVNNPACDSGSPTTAQMVMPVISGAVDAYIGYPVMSTAMTNPQARQWLQERFGLNDGKAACASLCGVFPARALAKVCEEDDDNGRHCFAPGDTGDGPNPYSNTGPVTQVVRGNAKVVCTNVKNWSTGINRYFTLEGNF
jgi:hypothetical protein